ncbi:hypothetical protein [Arthrobacter sp. SX1312]|uniref:glycosyltransferase family protein n=1 Tax=Arthrobacter sp. SX1312 TaxID=2058896 RepID=UPI0011B08891|nr:hypothetical protein [Arthrobacter sp. SX1312]
MIEAVPAPHHLYQEVVLPRYAAWHVLVASEQLDCAVIVVGDMDTGHHCLQSKTMAPKVWQVVDFDGVDDLQRLREPLAMAVLSGASRLIVADEGSRGLLEARFPEATAKTVVVPWASSGASAVLHDSSSDAVRQQFALELSKALPRLSGPEFLGDRSRILFAGHDFKFAGELLGMLAARSDVELRADLWEKQNVQDEARSELLLDWANVIFCEFASHNAVWYSWEKKETQFLVVRFHGYELYSDWIKDVNFANVDMFVFVSEFYRDQVIEALGWPIERTAVIPNAVDALDLQRQKMEGARFHLGIAGIVPILKRPDRALDLLELLLESDRRYTLHIRGRSPWQYKWMWDNLDVRDAYEAFYDRIASNPRLRSRVVFEEFGPDMGRWFQKIGWVLSPSTRETFHLAPVEGMASGAVPVVWQREGANEIFGPTWVHSSTEEAANHIIETNRSTDSFTAASSEAQVRASGYDILPVGDRWLHLLASAALRPREAVPLSITVERMKHLFLQSPTSRGLGRLISVLLRDGHDEAVESLVQSHPELVRSLPASLLSATLRTSAVQAIRKGSLQIPKRAEGAAYLPDRRRVLHVVEPAILTTFASQEQLDYATAAAPANSHVRFAAVTQAVGFTSSEQSVATNLRAQDCEGPEMVYVPLVGISDVSFDQYVLTAADALVRQARIFRPAFVRARREYSIALPALIAARRIGVPFVCDAELDSLAVDPYVDSVVLAEADATWATGEDPTAWSERASRHYSLSLATHPGSALKQLRVGIIADDFTSATIANSFNSFRLSRAEGYLEVATLNLDAVFVESAWEGHGREWYRGIAHYADQDEDILRIVKVARKLGVPLLFWNKEDPVHFGAFRKTAALMDHVFTTDADVIGRYWQNEQSVNKTVASMPFYASPEIHNPLPANRPYEHSASFAGTFYGQRFKDRSEELSAMLDTASPFGLAIYDRQVNVANTPYHFPDDLAPHVRPGVSYADVLDVYKAHPVNINVNSVSDSPTMFSRRVVEVAASGSLVLSGKGRGICEQIEDIEASGSPERWQHLLKRWMNNENDRLEDSWKQLRSVARSHLAEHALAIMFRTAGMNVSLETQQKYVLTAESADLDLLTSILDQTVMPAGIVAFNPPASFVRTLAHEGITLHQSLDDVPMGTWIGQLDQVPLNSYYEDLLYATKFGEWDHLSARSLRDGELRGTSILELSDSGTFPSLALREAGCNDGPLRHLTWIYPS